MEDNIKTSDELICELEQLRQQVADYRSKEIECKQTEETLRQRNLELELFNRASRAFNSTLDLDQVLAATLTEVRSLLGVNSCSVWLIESATQELVCQHAADLQMSQIVTGWRLAPGQGLAGWVAQNGESLIVPDTRSDTRHYKGVDSETGLEIRSILAIPLQTKKSIIGVLQLVDETVDRFGPPDLRLVEPVAMAAAVAIENARLHQETERLRVFNEKIVQSVEAGILLCDAMGRITFANSRVVEESGFTAEELKRKHWKEFIAPDHLARFRKEVASLSGTAASKHETTLIGKQGQRVPTIISIRPLHESGRLRGILAVLTDITERKQAEEEREKLITELQDALAHIKTLSGLLPICASCKKVRDDEGYWHQVEVYIRKHSDANFTHSICPDCAQRLYPDYFKG